MAFKIDHISIIVHADKIHKSLVNSYRVYMNLVCHIVMSTIALGLVYNNKLPVADDGMLQNTYKGLSQISNDHFTG